MLFSVIIDTILKEDIKMLDWLFKSDYTSSILNVKWFSLTHIVILLIFGAFVVGIFFAFRRCSRKTKMIVLWVLYGISALNKLINLLYWHTPLSANYNNNALYLDPNYENFNVAHWINGALPWSLCALNLYFVPIYLLSKKDSLKQLAYTLMMVGAVVALFIPIGFEYPNPWILFDYYFNHLVYFMIPLLLVLWKMFTPSIKHVRVNLFYVIAILVIAYLISMIFNWTINPHYNPDFINTPNEGWLFTAIWTVYPGGTIPFNFLFAILPVPLLYMVLFLPILIIVWFLLLLPFTTKEELKALPKNFVNYFKMLPKRIKRIFVKKDIEVEKTVTLLDNQVDTAPLDQQNDKTPKDGI
jgi:hypothetical protein